MKPSPDELEKLIHQTLRSLPDRRAPRSLEGRVLAAIAAQAALPWWKQSYARWPLAVRCAFLVVSGAIAKAVIMATVWAMSGAEGAQLVRTVAGEFAWVSRLSAAVTTLGDFGALLLRSIPAPWLYGGLAGFALLYATLFGLGATAYRTLYANR